MLGKKERELQEGEVEGLRHLRRSFAASHNMQEGDIVNEEDLILLRPAWGVLPSQAATIVGNKLKRNISSGELINEDDVEN